MQLIIDMGNTQPKYPINLTVYPDGKALMTSGADVHEVGVKTLGEHGELVDADKLKQKQKHSYKEFFENVVSVYDIDNAPVVLEATK